MAKFIYFVVDGKVFFDVRIGGRNIRFGLIVVVIRYEVLYSVFGKKFAEFVTELSRQSLIVRNDERRPLYVLYDVSHGERLAAARYSDENLTFQTVFETFGKALYSLGLVTRRLIFGM